MLRAWQGPYGGVPPWNEVRADEFLPAFDVAIESAQQDIEAIANNPDPPTFKNTIVALENAGRMLNRLETVFDVHASNLNLGPIPDIERVVAPKMSQHQDSIYQNSELFARIAAIYESDAMKTFDTAKKRLVDDLYKTFVRRGAKLSEGDKAKLSQINTRLARLFTDFSQNILEDEKFVTWVTDKSKLAGLPDSVVSAMANAAEERGKAGTMGDHEYSFIDGSRADLCR